MKTNREILSSVLKTAQMGQVGIRSVLDAQPEERLSSALKEQLNQYDSIERQAYAIAAARGWEPEALAPASKAMSKAYATARLSFGNVNSRAAAMMIEGNTRGLIKGLKNLSHGNCTDSQVQAIAENLLDYERNNIRKMEGFV